MSQDRPRGDGDTIRNRESRRVRDREPGALLPWRNHGRSKGKCATEQAASLQSRVRYFSGRPLGPDEAFLAVVLIAGALFQAASRDS